jgi:hypothetical protein
MMQAGPLRPGPDGSFGQPPTGPTRKRPAEPLAAHAGLEGGGGDARAQDRGPGSPFRGAAAAHPAPRAGEGWGRADGGAGGRTVGA